MEIYIVMGMFALASFLIWLNLIWKDDNDD